MFEEEELVRLRVGLLERDAEMNFSVCGGADSVDTVLDFFETVYSIGGRHGDR